MYDIYAIVYLYVDNNTFTIVQIVIILYYCIEIVVIVIYTLSNSRKQLVHSWN